MKICCFGSLNLDYVYRVSEFVQSGETIRAKERTVVCGGKGLNQSVALARSGVEVYHAGNVGVMDGQMLISTLQANNVCTDLISSQNYASGHAIIQVNDNGENSILLYGGANLTVTERQIEHVLSHFTEGDFLVLQNEVNMLPTIIEKAYEKGMLIVLNPSPVEAIADTLSLDKVGYLFMNSIEALEIGGGDDVNVAIRNIQTRYPKTVIICTFGAEGATVYKKETILHEPAMKVQAVDTTGAGDTFLGFYVGLLASGNDDQTCLKAAIKAAGLCVQKQGASISIPTHDQVIS
ncbi:Bifunctional ribokinase/ribose-5-phosphate isomerase A [bioreactor metagenome]|uniref:Ribokinase n=1 Tax=bioreactor metagenome TaxID=1076179 RepID=A0A644ZEA0_9ZZZZ